MSTAQRQQQFLRFFDIQQKQERVSHAYLLVGKNDTRETALHMAKRMFCEHGGCDACTICERIDAGTYADLHTLGGKDQALKKEEILDLQSELSQTAFESRQRKVYIIEDVDQASVQAMNSLLKFLEEPTSEIVAILTTQNLPKVLETIQSRCLIVHLKPYRRNALYQEIVNAGFDARDAHYLAYISKDSEAAVKIGASKDFRNVIDFFAELITDYERRDYELAGIKLQVACKEHKFDAKMLDWLCTFHIAYYNETQENNSKFRGVARAALTIQDRIKPGVIISMLCDQFAYTLLQETEI